MQSVKSILATVTPPCLSGFLDEVEDGLGPLAVMERLMVTVESRALADPGEMGGAKDR